MAGENDIPDQADGEGRSASASPLIFVSHDSRDAELAELFSKLLARVSAGVLKSFRSSDRKGSQGIEYGAEWYPNIMAKLDTASDVVCLLTQRSLDRPWILYEAGVAKGKLNTPVYGVALGIPLKLANTGPFAQFQNCDDDEDALTKLVMQLLERIPNAEPDREAIQTQVRDFKARASEVLERLDEDNEPTSDGSPMDDTSVAKLFEEVKVMFNELPARVEDSLTERLAPVRRWRGRRFHPMMLFEMADMISTGPDDPIGILVLVSLIRDDMPWLYELGMEAYRAGRAGHTKAAHEALMRLQRSAEQTVHGPWMEELGGRDSYIWLRELSMMLERWLARVPPQRAITARSRRGQT